MKQRTISQDCSLQGKSLHTGDDVTLRIKPAPENHGIVFKRVDVFGAPELKPSHEIYTEIMTATQDQNVAIVIQDEQTLHASWEVFMNLYHPSTKKKFWIAPIAREDLVEKIVREADLIFVSPMCWDEMRKRAPASKQLKTYENFISQETIDHLRELQLLG